VQSNGDNSTLCSKNWISKVERKSPAAEAGMRAMRVFEQDASVTYGDAIVAVGGNDVSTFVDLESELNKRVPGEQIQITLEDKQGERRVVYLTLAERPTSER